MQLKFIHIADVHLGMKPDQGCPWSEERTNELYQTFYDVIEYTEKEQIDLLLIAGDLFHRQPTLSELENINYYFKKLTKTKVVMIAGNHDYVSPSSEYRGIQWADHVKMLSWEKLEHYYIEEWNTHIYGYSYEQQDVKENRLAQVTPICEDGIHIVLAHGGDTTNNPLSKQWLQSMEFDYVALGHIHKAERISERVAYPGSLEPLNKTESGDHGFIQGWITEEELTLKFVTFAKRSYEEVRIMVDGMMVEQEIYDTIKAELQQYASQNLFTVILEGAIDSTIAISEPILYQMGNIVDVLNATYPDYDYMKLYYENKDNIVGKYIEAIRRIEVTDEEKDMALYYGVKALLHSTK